MATVEDTYTSASCGSLGSGEHSKLRSERRVDLRVRICSERHSSQEAMFGQHVVLRS